MSLITPGALQKLGRFVAIDATWYLPTQNRDGYKEYLDERLPGAVYFNVDGIKSESEYPHMMPTREIFESEMSKLGISPSDKLVVYDKQSFFSAPRALWMLRTFMHNEAYLLDNFADYKAQGHKLESGEPKHRKTTNYKSTGVLEWILFEELKDLVESNRLENDIYLLDARPETRFTGEDPEPRPSVPSGHVPGAFSVPMNQVLKDGHVKDPNEVRELLKNKGITDFSRNVIVMCGSGVTACVLKQAVDSVFDHEAKVYDGSWSEWGVRAPELVVRT